MGNRHPSIAPYETLSCRDGLIALACGNDGQFRKLATVLGEPGLAEDPRFATNAARVGHREELVTALEGRLSVADVADWQARLTAAGVPAGPVNDLAGAFDLAERLGLAPTHDLGPGVSPQVRHAVTYSRPLVTAPAPPPRLGEHTDSLREWLSDPSHSSRPAP
ncbi:hypothetical protein GCM10025883_31500 [Mobilicoccus caccae]|uniref:CoA-transferase family III n=1 Tax=Mobilicoccus caccae TaxID=1859295 RepID=A0ABQ6IT53_9MICO|nr:hypothetical protein GCM10025883_31500 [Mobilicoccus caccae]